MKCTIPEISWHNRDPVLSVDIQPKLEKNEFHRLASGGTDSHVLIWYLKEDKQNGGINLDVVADLTRHQRAVNCVRWSPSGELLASGDDESVIFIWKLKSETETLNIFDNTNDSDKEIWITLKILRGHREDVYDLNWSSNSLNLISGSVDNTAMIWDVAKGKSTAVLSDHKGFVQGVAWDPLNQFVATLSTDRYLRMFDINTKKVVSRNSKCILPVPESHSLHNKCVRLFHDDTLQTFFRRLAFSPDGSILVTPSGVTDNESEEKPLNTTYIYTRASWKQPAVILPSPEQYTVAVRFCPVLFKLRPHSETNAPVIPLPYRMIFAVATKSCVYLYDTQQTIPFGVISNIHYTRLTDLAWSSDGRVLIVSSTDGFCSIILFSESELGEKYCEEESKSENDNQNSEIKIGELSPDSSIHKAIMSKNNVEPKPIEIRKKPREIHPVVTETKIKDDIKPTPIEIRRKPKPEIKEIKDLENILKVSENKNIIIPPIISSEEKFESPKKDDKPVTPIAIRRQPRIIEQTPGNSTKATPIEIRRKPRDIFPSTPKQDINCPAVEEAVDTWPTLLNNSPNSGSTIVPMEIDRTEDIRLVYEDDEDEMEIKTDNVTGTPTTNKANNSLTTTPKTPRRVDFKTISTPKSKKKIL